MGAAWRHAPRQDSAYVSRGSRNSSTIATNRATAPATEATGNAKARYARVMLGWIPRTAPLIVSPTIPSSRQSAKTSKERRKVTSNIRTGIQNQRRFMAAIPWYRIRFRLYRFQVPSSWKSPAAEFISEGALEYSSCHKLPRLLHEPQRRLCARARYHKLPMEFATLHRGRPLFRSPTSKEWLQPFPMPLRPP